MGKILENYFKEAIIAGRNFKLHKTLNMKALR